MTRISEAIGRRRRDPVCPVYECLSGGDDMRADIEVKGNLTNYSFFH